MCADLVTGSITQQDSQSMMKALYQKQRTNTTPAFCWYVQEVESRQQDSMYLARWKLKKHFEDSQ